MTQTTVRYSKCVMQLEKGLPPNGVVPILKGKVNLMRDRVGIIKYRKKNIFRSYAYEGFVAPANTHISKMVPIMQVLAVQLNWLRLVLFNGTTSRHNWDRKL